MTRTQRFRLAVARFAAGAGVKVPRAWLANNLGVLAPKQYSVAAALEFPAVGAAVRLVSRELARMELRVEERQAGRWRPVDDASGDPEAAVVGRAWAPYQSRLKGMTLLVRSVLLHGFGAVYVERSGRLQLTGLRVLDPSLTHRAPTGAGEIAYRYDGIDLEGRGPGPVDRRDLLWVDYEPPFDRHSNTPPLKQVWASFRMAIAAQRFAAAFFGSGATGNVVYQSMQEGQFGSSATVSEDMWEREARMAAAGKRSMVLPENLSAQVLTANPQHAQLIQLLVHGVQDVARVFGVSPIALADLSRGTYSNSDQQVRFTSRFTLEAIAAAVADEIGSILWPSGFRRVVLDASDVGDESREVRARRLRDDVNAGIRTVNEARALQGAEEVSDPAADELRQGGGAVAEPPADDDQARADREEQEALDDQGDV